MKKLIISLTILSLLLVSILGLNFTRKIRPEDLYSGKYDSTYIIFEKNNCSDCKILNSYIAKNKKFNNYKKVYLDTDKDMKIWKSFIKKYGIKEVPSIFYIDGHHINYLSKHTENKKIINDKLK